jgi:hypothetical protein
LSQTAPFPAFLRRGKNPNQALKQEISPKQALPKERGYNRKIATGARQNQNEGKHQNIATA